MFIEEKKIIKMILNKKYSERRLLSDWINLIHLEVSPVVVTFVRIKLNGHLLSNEIVETSNIFCEALLGAVHFVDQRPIDEYLAFHSILVIHEESCRLQWRLVPSCRTDREGMFCEDGTSCRTSNCHRRWLFPGSSHHQTWPNPQTHQKG